MLKISLFKSRKALKFCLLVLVILTVITATFYLTQFVALNDTAQIIVNQFGYIGVLVLAIIAGLNAFVPVPAATFVPIFLAAGLWLPLIILMLVIGTTVADLIGYFIGQWSRELVEDQYPRTYATVLRMNAKHHRLTIPLVFLYSAFAPFPNEAMLIPLAVAGVKLRIILLPLILGTLVNQTLLAYGFTSIFTSLF